MTRTEKIARLKQMVKQIGSEADLEALASESPSARAAESRWSGMEALPTAGAAPAVTPKSARVAVDKVMTDTGGDLSDSEVSALEAIVLREGRPVAFIRNGKYDELADPWRGLNATAVRNRIQPLFPSIGRVDLPNSSVPYGGTAFVVGPDLLMTNRHVAALFTVGLGLRGLRFRSGDAGVNFRHEVDSPPDDTSWAIDVREVVMVHPYWDMSLLKVSGLPAAHPVLRLGVAPPEDLVDSDVVVVGYPALDPRNDIDLQNQIFERKYEVKRLHPGKLRRREAIRSFENVVNAATHDSSTLGGNSGSAVVDVRTGEVIALHFAGVYLKANYAVPTYELARDRRVVDAGLNFAGRVPPTGEWDSAWAGLEGTRTSAPAPQPHVQQPSAAAAGGATTLTIPIQLVVSVGPPAPARVVPVLPAVAGVEARAMQPPKVYPNLKARAGYQPDFLDLEGGAVVPLPKLTAKGKKMAAEVDDGEHELKYHHFSVVMHKKRRLALFTAANVDWRRPSREVDGEVPSRRELTEIPDGMAEEWVADRRISLEEQLPDVFFTKDRAAWDKGHLVRRDDVCWGDDDLPAGRKFKDIQKANGDTYHTTNCSPQVAGFNRPGAVDNWGDLEKMVQQETRAEKVILFSGPVLADDDREFQGRDLNGEVWVPIPSRFWKVVVANGDDGPRAYGFVLEQDTSDVRWEELAIPPRWERHMKPIAEIEKLLFGLADLTWLKKHDGFESEEGVRMAGRVRAQ
ncbi:MAG: DNA/RNA non-specific endonuclease [Zavarzinella sp.]|nr:DNA/RNA non-specific endonuclease [Zavarzinella sp.]